MRPEDDSDWLTPDAPMTAKERFAALLLNDPGVYRFEAPEESCQPFASIVTAMTLPPATPEAVIRDAADRALAVCAPDTATWMLTRLGAMRHELDALHEATDDRKDFADECAREDRRDKECA